MTHVMSREPKTLQTNIIKRALGDKKYPSFLGAYKKARQVNHYNRQEDLERPLTKIEHQIAYAYLNETDTAVSEIVSKFGMQKKNCYNSVMKLCARLLYQNKKKLNF